MRDWVAFSSSSGHTFQTVWRALGSDSRNHFRGLFIDRKCGSLSLAHEFLSPDKIFDYSQVPFEDSYLKWANEISAAQKPIIFLIGYFKIITPKFFEAGFPMVNTHPSLLPAFPGLDKKVHAMAFEKTLVSGFSVHVVSEDLDAGPIVFQKSVSIADAKSGDEVRERVRGLEQKYLPKVIEKVLLTDLVGDDRRLSTRELQKKFSHKFSNREEGFPICVD